MAPRISIGAGESIINGLPTSEVPNAPNFAMPYWNWTKNRKLPIAFTVHTKPDGTANALFNSTRKLAATGSIPSEAVSAATMQSIYLQTKFTSFGSGSVLTGDSQRKKVIMGMLEATPHNTVHNTIAGDMATMLSPRDPIFFLHHANIDRIWASSKSAGWGQPDRHGLAQPHLRQQFRAGEWDTVQHRRPQHQRRGISLRRVTTPHPPRRRWRRHCAKAEMDPGRDRRSPDRSA